MATSPPRDQVESVLAELIKESLERRESTQVPGLGTFSVRHQNAHVDRSEDGEARVLPPRDEIVFTQSS